MKRTMILFGLIAAAVSYPMLTSRTAESQGEPDFDLEQFLSTSSNTASRTPTSYQSVASSNLVGNPGLNALTNVANPAWNSPSHLPNSIPPNMMNSNLPMMGAQPIFWPGPTTPPSRIYQPTTNLAEVIRFDVYPNWVKARWQRVANTPGELNMEGMRVPLVTGSSAHDLTGALTYYFDDRHQVQRICFQGWTGDAAYLVQLLTEQYGFKAQPTGLAGLYLKKTWGGTHSLLRLDHPSIVNQAEPQRQMFVYLELNHPKGNLPLSMTSQNLLATAQ